ncbi:MAG: hypothetical protein M1839_002803 [Geoglossum umbratile]|nr:MAG: hypothetical protein M1839_002803 [Geoglossum umbratile]
METQPGEVPSADPRNPDDVFSEVIALRRRLCAVETKYAAAVEELERARDALGYYKIPFRFLKLPREIRDQIYLYALQAPIEARPQPIRVIRKRQAMFKPPTPSLCLLNRQVYEEANEILYTKNTIAFDEPQQIPDFLGKIGMRNRDLIRSISVFVIYNPPLLGEIGIEPRHWVNAFARCGLQGITSMHVKGEYIGQEWIVSMDPPLRSAVTELLQRDKESGATRRLQLTGFNWEEWRKFPKDWVVTARQWNQGKWDEEWGECAT